MSVAEEGVDIAEEGVDILLLGPLYGWICALCSQTRTGFPDKEDAKRSASSHAMTKHVSGYPSGKTSMTLYVQWDGPESGGTDESSG